MKVTKISVESDLHENQRHQVITELEHRYGEPLHAWIHMHIPYQGTEHDKQTYWKIVNGILGELPYLFQKRGEPTNDAPTIRVVGTYLLHGLKLPICSIQLPDGSQIRFRWNLYNWAISVKLAKPIGDARLIEDFASLFDASTRYTLDDFQGFTPDWLLPAFVSDQQNFSFQLKSPGEMSVFCFLLARSLELR